MSGDNKVCSRCHQEKPLTEFRFAKSRGDYQRYCIPCQAEDQRERHGTVVKVEHFPEGMKRCSRCKSVKTFEDFPLSKSTTCGRGSWCKACLTEYRHADPDREQRQAVLSTDWHHAHKKPAKQLKYQIPEVAPSSVQCAYAAGLVDAEGSLRLQPSTVQYAPYISVYNGDRSILEWMQRVFTGNILAPKRKNKKTESPEFALIIANKTICRWTCQVLVPYLTIKKSQAELMLKSIDSPVSERVEISAQISELNRRGVQDLQGLAAGSMKFDDDVLATRTPEEWAYLAGYVDGDGTFAMQPQNEKCYHYPWLVIYSTKTASIRWIYERFGGNLVIRKRYDSSAIAHELSIRFVDQQYMEKIVRGIAPYIVAKKEQVPPPAPDVAVVKTLAEAASGAPGVEMQIQKSDATPVDASVHTLADYATRAS